jgi:hypothetical protein
MNLKTWYDSGLATVLSGSTTVTGTGALWGTGGPDDNIMVGDLFSVPSQPMVPAIPIAAVSADGELELLWAWPGADVTAQPYIIRYVGIIERSTRANRMALERMGEISAWYDVIVETDTDRLALETAGSPLRANYRVLVQNDGVIWGKATSAYGDWIGPVEFRGPSITLDVTEVDEVPFGVPPDLRLIPRAGGYNVEFDSPRGMIFEKGTITTLAPDQQAAWGWEPILGGYRLHLAIPRGPTGDIDGVTPFWVSRLGADADAEAARLALGAGDVVGPASAVSGAPVLFSETGKVLKEGAYATKPQALAGEDNEALTTSLRAMQLLADNAYSMCQGRLTLESGVPLSTTDQLGKTTVFWTPFLGDRIGLYSAGDWVIRAFTERAISLAGFAALLPYDIFAYDDSGVVALEALAWNNNLSRATGLMLQNGIPVKSGDPTRRYLGTIRTSAAGQTQIKFGSSAVGGGEAYCGIWNYYNRMPFICGVVDGVVSWTYSSNVWRAMDASNSNRINFVTGISEDQIDVRLTVLASSANVMRAGIGLNSTTTPFSGAVTAEAYTSPDVNQTMLKPSLNARAPIGFNYVQALEMAPQNGTTVTFFGTAAYQRFEAIIKM